MKNLKFLFLSFLLVAFLAPNVNAQKVKKVEPIQCALLIEEGWFFSDDAVVKITPSGQAQLKATFDLTEFVDVKLNGKYKKDAWLVGVELEMYGFEFTFTEHVIIDKNSIATVVWNFDVEILELN